jgi:Spx/MgsR family transcriptional regulator
MSSSDPIGSRDLGPDLAAHGVGFVDAPVSGAVPRAIAGTLTIMLGSDDAALSRRAKPVLMGMGNRVFETGSLGTGHAMKALNNFVAAAGFAAVAEALILAGRFGLDPKVAVEIMNVARARPAAADRHRNGPLGAGRPGPPRRHGRPLGRLQGLAGGGVTMPVTIYGIKNCDTMKKARAWLDARGVAYAFHDYKTAGLDEARLQSWIDALGWEPLLNRAGTTFRTLPDADKADLDAAKAKRLMLAQPSMVKRPVLDVDGRLTVGFRAEVYEGVFGG